MGRDHLREDKVVAIANKNNEVVGRIVCKQKRTIKTARIIPDALKSIKRPKKNHRKTKYRKNLSTKILRELIVIISDFFLKSLYTWTVKVNRAEKIHRCITISVSGYTTIHNRSRQNSIHHCKAINVQCKPLFSVYQ